MCGYWRLSEAGGVSKTAESVSSDALPLSLNHQQTPSTRQDASRPSTLLP